MTKVVRAGTNTMVMPLMTPGMLKRKNNLEKGLDAVGAQVSGCIDDVLVDFYQHIVDRKHHEGQEVVYHAEDDGTGGVDDAPGRAGAERRGCC